MAAPWIMPYYPGWQWNYLPLASIDFTALTHLAHFSLWPRADGTLDNTKSGGLPPSSVAAVVQATHKALKKILITIGCAGGMDAGFRAAIAPAVMPTLVQNIIAFATSNGYDGIDLDIETLKPTDEANVTAFVRQLKASLSALPSPMLLTGAASVGISNLATSIQILAPLASCFDMLNLMTYDLAGLWSGWVSWHNSPLFNGGATFPSTGAPIPCIDQIVTAFTNAGVPKAKLGVGSCFYGTVWTGVTGPGQPIWDTTKKPAVLLPWVGMLTYNGSPLIPYNVILPQYVAPNPAAYRWDNGAVAPYLTLPKTSTTPDMFVSYSDPAAVAVAGSYVRSLGLGGMIIWEAGLGWCPTQPVKDSLLQAAKLSLGVAS